MLIPQVAGGSVALCQRLDVSSWVVGVFRIVYGELKMTKVQIYVRLFVCHPRTKS